MTARRIAIIAIIHHLQTLRIVLFQINKYQWRRRRRGLVTVEWHSLHTAGQVLIRLTTLWFFSERFPFQINSSRDTRPQMEPLNILDLKQFQNLPIQWQKRLQKRLNWMDGWMDGRMDGWLDGHLKWMKSDKANFFPNFESNWNVRLTIDFPFGVDRWVRGSHGSNSPHFHLIYSNWMNSKWLSIQIYFLKNLFFEKFIFGNVSSNKHPIPPQFHLMYSDCGVALYFILLDWMNSKLLSIQIDWNYVFDLQFE